jgi:D-xylose transport system ATP-binding protein
MAKGGSIMAASQLLSTSGIRKAFPGVQALDGVGFDLNAGEIHALVGENGAGKSTLMKILSGVYPAGEFEGTISIDGAPQRFTGIRDAEHAGVAIVFQEFSLAPELSVAENIFLGRLPNRLGAINWNNVNAQAQALLKELEVDIPTETPVRELGIGQQQLVEIAKALSHNARILILDEPTAALNDAESRTLFTLLRRLRERGLGLIYISHRLNEVLELADRITVLRDGRSVATAARGDIDRNKMVSLMVGREISQVFPEPKRSPGAVALEVRNLSVVHPDIPSRQVLCDLNFDVRCGEVLGIAGLMGSGRTALLNVLFGSFPETFTGKILIEQKEVPINSPADAIRNGIALVTEDRKRFGLSLSASIADNMTLVALSTFATSTVINKQKQASSVSQMMNELRVKATSAETLVETLSGGNQQKVVLGKWLMNSPRILLLDEPTRGIDVGAKQEIYQRIDDLAHAGLAIVMVSSELEELRGVCDRILVMHEGRITGRLSHSEASAERIMACATGTTEVA